MASEVVLVAAAGAFVAAHALEQRAGKEEGVGRIGIGFERAIAPGERLVQAALHARGERAVIRDRVGERGRELPPREVIQDRPGVRGTIEPQEGDGRVDARLDRLGVLARGPLERAQRARGIVLDQEGEAAQVLRRTAGETRERLERALRVAMGEVARRGTAGRVDRRARGTEGREENQREETDRDQAAPRICSSIWMSPAFTARSNAATTRGSKREVARLAIFWTT